MSTTELAGKQRDHANRILVLVREPETLALISAQVVKLLGLSVVACETVEAFNKALAEEMSAIILAIADLSLIEEESDDLLGELGQYGVPLIGLYSRTDNCPRLSGKQIIASIDRDSEDQMATISGLAENIFENRRIRIIVMHPHDKHRAYLHELLNSHFYTVMQAADVAEAMELLSLYPQTQLLLMDEKCSTVSGFDIIDTLRETFHADQLAILTMVAQRDPGLIARLFESGASDVIATSSDDVELLARVGYQARTINHIRKLRRRVYQDGLTGAYTNDYFDDIGKKIFASSQRGNMQLGFAVINIDDFSTLNEMHGAAVGDLVLCAVADQLRQLFRDTDIIARKEGDEFLCLISCVGRRNIHGILDRVCQQIAKKGVWYGKDRLPVTVTVGGTAELGASLETMQTRAEMALRQIRKEGKNRVGIL
ncbi:MAG: diguanylate cyclase [Gammaproteobacteria bacterium]|nr:diguanylate cyclase [Gammaproteobacteria bacterium]